MPDQRSVFDQIDDDVGALDDLIGNEGERALRLCAVRVARILRVHPLLVDRIEMHGHLLEGSDVEQRRDDDRSGECFRIDA